MTLRSIFTLACFLAVPAAAQAADLQTARTPAPAAPTATGYIVTVSGTIEASPRYPGSDKMGLSGMPSLDWRRVGEPERFSAPDDGFDLTLFDWSGFRFGPVARFRDGRFYEGNREIVGLHKIDWTIEGGAFLEFFPVEFLRARAEIRRGFNGHEGVVGNVALDVVQRFGAFTFSIGPRLALGDSEFTREFFGVTPIEAELNRRVTPFKPDGGVTSVGALTSLRYKWSEQWATTVYAGYDRLMDDAGRSPIPRNLGSRDQYTVGASLSYSFYFPGF